MSSSAKVAWGGPPGETVQVKVGPRRKPGFSRGAAEEKKKGTFSTSNSGDKLGERSSLTKHYTSGRKELNV